MDYDVYNREERYVCSHLFRLLHEPMDDNYALSTYLRRPIKQYSYRIYAEVALLRDAYYARKPNTGQFLDELVRMLMAQEDVFECRLYTELPEGLNNSSMTHPKQIRQKAGNVLSRDEGRVYGALQGMFNAKPDLAICIDDDLLIYEAKLTLDFDREQMERTKNIAKVWAKLLFKDLGFVSPPNVQVLKLGLAKYKPDVSWQEIADIADTVYPAEDRTRSVLAHAATMA